MITRLVGLLFSLTVATTAAYVAVQWSSLYVQEFKDWTPFQYFEQVYTVLFAALGLVLGFTLASLIYRQGLELSGGLLSDLRRVPARDKAAVVLGVFIGLGMTALLGMLLIRIEKFGPQLVLLVGILWILDTAFYSALGTIYLQIPIYIRLILIMLIRRYHLRRLI